MKLLAFNEFGFQNPIANLIVISIFLGGFFISNYYVIRGIIYLVKHWLQFSRKWRIILSLGPFFFLAIAATEPLHLVIPTLPFGLLGGFPAIFFFTIRYGPNDDFIYKLLGLGGMMLNALAFIGILAQIEKRREKKLP